jgi:hypothetical protein
MMTQSRGRHWLLIMVLLMVPGLGAGTVRAQEGGGRPETVCLQCHGGQQGRLGAPVGLWRKSVHAANGISCHDCHGGDPTDFANAMSPEKGFLGAPAEEKIPAFCGRCHVGVLEDYRTSKHGLALGKGGPQCVTCHGNHAVVKASLALINEKDCTRCHDFARAKTIKEALTATDAMISGLEEDLSALHRVGISVKEMRGEVFDQRNKFHRLFHSVDVEKVRSETAGFQAALGKIRDQVEVIQGDLKQRKLWGGAAILLLVLAGLFFLLLRRTYHEEEKS